MPGSGDALFIQVILLRLVRRVTISGTKGWIFSDSPVQLSGLSALGLRPRASSFKNLEHREQRQLSPKWGTLIINQHFGINESVGKDQPRTRSGGSRFDSGGGEAGCPSVRRA